MIDVESAELWERLKNLSKTSKKKSAAVAYVSDDSVISFGKDDLLIADASNSSISSGNTSARVLEKAFQKGANLYSCDTLHGKVIVFDNYAYIGSANISNNSRKNLDEIGIITDHPHLMSSFTQLIESLKRQSIKIDKEFIQRILKIEVNPNNNSPKTVSKNIQLNKTRKWLISLRNDVEYPGNENVINEVNEQVEVSKDEEPGWFWIKKGNRFYNDAKIGDSVVIIDRDKSLSKKPQRAYRHTIIKEITSEKLLNSKVYHYAYTDKYMIKWSIFKNLAKKAGITNLGSGLNTIRELSEKQSNILFELWDA